MDRSRDLHDSSSFRLITAAWDSVVGACKHAQSDIKDLRFTACACERDSGQPAITTLESVGSLDFGGEVASDIAQWPCAHRNSA